MFEEAGVNIVAVMYPKAGKLDEVCIPFSPLESDSEGGIEGREITHKSKEKKN